MTLSERSVNLPMGTAAAGPATPVKRKKPGPKPKPLSERKYRPLKPIQRPESTYSREKKISVLMFLEHHRIYDPTSLKSVDGYRKPSQSEAAIFFKIPRGTLATWVVKSQSIINGDQRSYSPHWPDLEELLFTRFLATREERKIVTTGWFKRQARELFKTLVKDPKLVKLFTFSNGWWAGFRRRYNIVRRRVTKQSTHRPEEYLKVANHFLRYIRRVSNKINTLQLHHNQSPKMDIKYILDSPKRRFEKKYILNVDETPIPFEYLDGQTYELRGARTVAGATDRSGWSKRQATLVLYIFADGSLRIRPKIIFHGKPPPTGRIFDEEGHLYSPDVTVEFNDTAYNNEELFLKWIDEELPTAKSEKRDFLLVMDVATFHKTKPVMDLLREKNVTVALIPPGCTSLLQPLDVSINRPFKDWLREETELYIEEREKQGLTEWSTRDKRVMTTWVVARAAARLEQRPELVEKSFLNCGISIRPDGTQDDLIRIKDIPLEDIDFIGWESAEEVYIKQEEIVDQLCDEEQMMLGGDSLFDVQGVQAGLLFMKKPQLIEMAKRHGVPSYGNKKDIINRIISKYTEGSTAEAPILVGN